MFSSDKKLAIYYGFLLILLVSWTSRVTNPHLVFRLLYTFLFVLPLFFTNKIVTPIVFIIFGTITNHAFNYSYMPSQSIVYAGIIVILLLTKKCFYKQHIPPYLWIMLILFTLVDVITNLQIDFISESFLVLILLLFFITYDSFEDLKLILFSFSIISLILSFVYFAIGDQFVEMVKDSGIERRGWMDANYFSTVVGMGVFTSIVLLFEGKESVLKRTLYILSASLSFVVMVLVASRGGLLAVSVALMLFFLLGHFPVKYKLISVLAIVGFVLALYRFGFFELLEYRLTQEETLESGSGRTYLWQMKYNYFVNEYNLMEQMFGVGYRKGIALGEGNLGFHNDFFAFLMEYGIVGVVLLIVFLFHPIFKSTIMRRETIASAVYLILCCFTLEPISSGRLTYFLFYILIIMFSKMRKLPLNKV